MYLAVDVGASKTLIATFDAHGRPTKVQRIKTAPKYSDFKADLSQILAHPDFKGSYIACCCAIPGKIDRVHGTGITFGNLAWHNVPIRQDLENLLPHTQVFIENDALLAGFFEASVLKDKFHKILYLTISTGIGAGIIAEGEIDPVLADSEVGHMVLLHNNHLEKWEDFASGRALKEKYGKLASEIDDSKIWRQFAANVAQGIDALLSVVQPEAVVIGGGVGAHLEKFKAFLADELKKFQNNMVKIPPIVKAKKPEEAVIYGCYEYAKTKAK